jgi:hypothetical protein
MHIILQKNHFGKVNFLAAIYFSGKISMYLFDNVPTAYGYIGRLNNKLIGQADDMIGKGIWVL